MTNKKTQSIVQLLLFIGVMIFLNIIGNVLFTQIDLTEDKRFTLTEPTKKMLGEIEDVLYVNLLLEGEFPAGFKRLQKAALEMLDDFRSISGYIEYEVENPSEGTIEDINGRREQLAKDGIVPTRLRLKEADETSEQYIYPWAIFNYHGRSIPVNLLENQIPGMPPEEALNNSVSLLEYKFANAIQKVLANRQPVILFTKGHGELEAKQTAFLQKELAPFYDIGRVNLDSITQIPQAVNVLIIARPRFPFTEQHKFKIDQYVMNGGKVIWLIDRLNAQLDSMRTQASYLPMDYPLNLEDLLFRYGVKIEPNLVLDLECSRIPQVVGQQGNSPQLDLFPWFYHPVVTPKSNHPIVKSLDRVNFLFPSSIDINVRTKSEVKKTVLLASSQYTRLQFTPVRLNFEILRYEPDPAKFNKPAQPLAVLLEGVFPSLYENRVTTEMMDGLETLRQPLKNRSEPTRMLVVSDGDIAKNLVLPNEEIRPTGYNKYERYVFANKDFMVNAIEYLIDDGGVIEARGKEVKLRLLDTVKAKAEKTKWRLINIVLPIVFLLLFGLLFSYLRKRKYAS